MITTIHKKDYILNKVDGRVTIRELLTYAQSNVDTWVSDPVLWDLSNGTITEDSSDYEAVRAVVENIHDLVEKRKGRKTVFVAPDPFTYGMLRMAITIVECAASLPVASVFYDIGSAHAWLKES